jgi:hypothetical protein
VGEVRTPTCGLPSPAAAAHRRIWGEWAFAARGSEDERARIRVAAGATTTPKLRIALEKASANDADKEQLSAALAELEAHEGS